jgi:hypothetical protein
VRGEPDVPVCGPLVERRRINAPTVVANGEHRCPVALAEGQLDPGGLRVPYRIRQQFAGDGENILSFRCGRW